MAQTGFFLFSFRTIALALLFLLLISTEVSTTISTPPSTSAPISAHAPNIILLLIDDAGYDDLPSSPLPCPTLLPSLHLPHMASLASNGASFINAYVTAPQCSPSRAAILTGALFWLLARLLPYI